MILGGPIDKTASENLFFLYRLRLIPYF